MNPPPETSRAWRAGRVVQGLLLAMGITAVVFQLLHAATEMTFRYGGF